MHDRLIPFEGVYNFRDFGGYAAPGGAVKRGRLYRSANLFRATEADQDALRRLGVAVVIDLRRTREREKEPSAWPADATPRIVVSDDGERGDLPPHLQFLRDTGSLEPQTVREYMTATYRRIPYEERHVALYRNAFAALAEAETPTLVHCAAGKDRTGVLCALVLGALGVGREDIYDDYALTNHVATVSGILEQAAARFSERLGRTLSPEQLQPMVGVETGYLDAAFAEIAARSGSTQAYLRDTLGVSDDALSAIRGHLIEEEERVA